MAVAKGSGFVFTLYQQSISRAVWLRSGQLLSKKLLKDPAFMLEPVPHQMITATEQMLLNHRIPTETGGLKGLFLKG